MAETSRKREDRKSKRISMLFGKLKQQEEEFVLSCPFGFEHTKHVSGNASEAYDELLRVFGFAEGKVVNTSATKIKIKDKHSRTSFKTCKALWNCVPDSHDELIFKQGDIIEVLHESKDGWWTGRCNGNTGLFPVNYTCLIDPDQHHTPTSEALQNV